MKGLGTLVLMLLLGVLMPDAAAGIKGVLPAGRNASPAKPALCNPFKERCDIQILSRSAVRKLALSKKRYNILPIPDYMAGKLLRRQGGQLAAHLQNGWAGPRVARNVNRWARLRRARRLSRWARLRRARRQNGSAGLRIDRMRINNVQRMRFD